MMTLYSTKGRYIYDNFEGSKVRVGRERFREGTE